MKFTQRWLEPLLVGIAVLYVEWQAAALPLRDQPIGTDWQRYLGNAVAINERQWGDYQAWRSPLHAFISLAVMPAAGHLLEASQWVSMGAIAVVIGATAALARRMVGPGAGLCAAMLLAGWPDMVIQARMSTPYPLFAAFTIAGMYTIDVCAGRRWMPAMFAALLFGLAAATDARGGGLAAAAVVGTMIAASHRARALNATPLPEDRWGRAAPVLIGAAVLAGAWLVRAILVGRVPVQLLSLLEQVALQRDLHAREGGIAACIEHRGVLPGIAELFGPCGQATAMSNLARLSAVAPVPWWIVAGLLALGAQRRNLMLVAVCMTVLPAAFIVGIEHRYLLPLAGPVAILVVAGARRIGGRRAVVGWVAVGVAFAGISVGWRAHDSLHARMSAPKLSGMDPRRAPAVRLVSLPPTSEARGWLREHARADSNIIDCAGLDLDLRLYPWQVNEIARNGRPSSRCVDLLAAPATPNTYVWARGTADPSWTPAPLRAQALRVFTQD